MFSRLLLLVVATAYLTISVECFNTQEKIKGLYPKTDESPKLISLTKRSPAFKDWYEDFKTRSKQVVHKVVPEPVLKLFRGKNPDSDDDYDSDDSPRNIEHGTLDSYGRDLARKVGDTISNVGKKIKFVTSTITGGLDCNKTFFSGIASKFKSKVQAIYPGTKWCGDGTKSRSYDDLGKYAGTDSCCREHDLCPDSMDAGETKYGLTNTGLFTRSHCDCDQRFYNCLKRTASLVSTEIGFTYFTILGPQCFKNDFPIVDCNQMKGKKCVEYEFDQSERKIYQWFDSPEY